MVIDYQPSQFAAVRSMDPDLLLEKVALAMRTPARLGAREETVADIVEIVLAEPLFYA
jgi:hypothetical protein